MDISSLNVEQKHQQKKTISSPRDVFIAFGKGRSITLKKKNPEIISSQQETGMQLLLLFFYHNVITAHKTSNTQTRTLSDKAVNFSKTKYFKKLQEGSCVRYLD